MALFKEEKGLALDQLSNLLPKLGLVMLKGRLFVNSAVTAKWDGMTAQWHTLASEKPDPWEQLVPTHKGKFSVAIDNLKRDKAIADGVVTTLAELKESLFKIG